jgi:hypothetical protein
MFEECNFDGQGQQLTTAFEHYKSASPENMPEMTIRKQSVRTTSIAEKIAS